MRCIKWLDKNFELLILALLLIVMCVLSFTNVIMRYCFRNALSWSDEVCCYCLALSAFFSLPCAIRMNSTIKVDTLLVVLPEKAKKILEMVCNFAMVAFLIYFLKGSIGLVQNAAMLGQKSPALQIPLVWLYGVAVVAIILAVVRYVMAIIKEFMKIEEKQEDSQI